MSEPGDAERLRAALRDALGLIELLPIEEHTAAKLDGTVLGIPVMYDYSGLHNALWPSLDESKHILRIFIEVKPK